MRIKPSSALACHVRHNAQELEGHGESVTERGSCPPRVSSAGAGGKLGKTALCTIALSPKTLSSVPPTGTEHPFKPIKISASVAVVLPCTGLAALRAVRRVPVP